MNKYLYIFLLIFTFSCDVQEEPFYNDFDSYINPEKKILIEDFTGHKCQNCPDASKEIKAIQNLYPNQVIALAIHVSSFAKPNPLGNPYDYLTVDKSGKQSIEFGVYGIPESILLNNELTIIKKFVGPINKNDLKIIRGIINKL